MFDNIGKKIKTLAKVICWAGIIASFIGAIIIYEEFEEIIFCILTLAVGALISWVGSFTLYGFGQLIDNSDILVAQGAAKASKSSQTAE